MKNIKIISLMIFILFSSLTWAQDNLNSYLEEAAENNPKLRARFSEYMSALEQVPQLKSLPDPQIAFAWFISPVETRMGPQLMRLSASQMFPWFGTLKAKENAAIQSAKAKYELFEEAKSKLFNDVKSVYYNLYFNNRAAEISLDNIGLLQSIAKMSAAKAEAGLVSMADEYRLEMQINELENQLQDIRDKNRTLETELRMLLNASPEKQFFIPSELENQSFMLSKQAALDSIMAKNHSLQQLGFEKAALDYRVEVAERSGNPDFRIGIDYIITGEGENELNGRDAIVFPAVGISIPLYRNKYRAMVKEASHLVSANEYKSEDKANALEVIFARAWNDYKDAERRIGLNERQSILAEKTLDLLETEYATANAEFEELLRMERMLLKYRLGSEKARVDKQAAIAFIYYLMGK